MTQKYPRPIRVLMVVGLSVAAWSLIILAARAEPPDLQSVNRAVNESIRYTADPEGRDVWTVGPVAGDCEDYALTKMVRLADQGVPLADMSILVVRAGRQFHAVLAIGDAVLDNRYPKIMRRKDYTVIRTVSANVALLRAKMETSK